MLNNSLVIESNIDRYEMPRFEIRDLANCSNYKGVFKTADYPSNKAVNVVKDGFQLLQHGAVYDAFTTFLDTWRVSTPTILNSYVSRKEHVQFSPDKSKMSLRFEFPELATSYHSETAGQEVTRNFFLLVNHGLDGDWGLTSAIGLMDFACANMEMGGEWSLFKAKHTNKFNMNSFMKLQNNFVDYYHAMRKTHDKHTQHKLSDHNVTEYLHKIPKWSKQMCDDEGRKLEHHDGTPIIELNKAGERIYDQWEYEREDKGNNLFALSSALTYWSTHDSNEFPVRQRKGEKNCLGVLAERQKFVGALLKEAPFAC